MGPVRFIIWVYFFLLIFEGALRKWILPELATPLLMVRDPVLLAAYAMAVARGFFPFNLWNSLLLLLGTAAFAGALFPGFGHGNWRIAAFGFRCLFMHLPLIFLMAKVFDLRDVLAFGRMMLRLSIPMTILLVIQFYSDADSWANRGLGGEGTSTFSGAAGFNRCSGTFSFSAGLAHFYTLAAAFFSLSFALNMGLSLTVRIMAGAAIMLAMPLSISRSLVLSGVIVGVASLIVYARGSFAARVLPRMILALVLLAAVTFSTQAGRDSITAFVGRWNVASEASEDGGLGGAIGGRVYGTFFSSFTVAMDSPELGWGLGLGTTFGAFEYFGVRAFLLGEHEWERVILEIGPFLGFLYLGYRTVMAFYLLRQGFLSLRKDNPAPLILLSATFYLLLTGQTGQTTSLGFLVFCTGLCFCALKLPPGTRLVEAQPKAEPLPFHPDLPAATSGAQG